MRYQLALVATLAFVFAFLCASAPALAASSAEDTAYKRCVAAFMDYRNQPERITVDLSDLGLTKKQVKAIAQRVHYNGELFWMNTYDDSGIKKGSLTYSCYYSDVKIDKMRKKLEARVKKALKRIGPGMDSATKVHMLHDWLIDRADYKSKKKTAYTAMVKGKADCFGFAKAMDVLLRRAGFSVDMAFNAKLDHIWNQVKIGGKWYHVDVTWDNGYTGKYFWKKERCHRFLLQSDAYMKKDSHKGWKANHACTSERFKEKNFVGGYFAKHCKAYKGIVRAFTSGELRYELTGVGKVSVAGIASSGKGKSALSVPARVTYKKVPYAVNGIARRAFAQGKAKTLTVASAKLGRSRVKDSLADSKVTRIRLVDGAKAKRSLYAQIFTADNAGKAARVS